MSAEHPREITLPRDGCRAFTEAEATELVRLCVIAGAEVGIPSTEFRVQRSSCGRFGPATRSGEARRAGLLALMHQFGPLAETRCALHFYDECGWITVTDALLGRVCHRAREAQ